jgi:gamma-glutamyltranspeptidase
VHHDDVPRPEEALNILSGYNLSAEPRVTALFHYLEASRLSYADRNAYVGDPRYVSVPPAQTRFFRCGCHIHVVPAT